MTAQGPLEGTLVLDFSQFLAGPVAAMRLADMGARVLKMERPGAGEIGRTLAFADRWIDGDSHSFHAMNRGKEGVVADLKNPTDLAAVRELIARADVLIQNFRPGVMERLGLGYDACAALNPGLVYASGSGYGEAGPWVGRPGQDLLAQSLSALPWVNASHALAPGSLGLGADASAGRPIPVGVAVADHLMSCHLATGILALLVRRARTSRGGLIETSLLEAMLDLETEVLTATLNDGAWVDSRPVRPSGLYSSLDGHVAVGFCPPGAVEAALGLPVSPDPDVDALARALAAELASHTTDEGLSRLASADIECVPLLDLDGLISGPEFARADMVQSVTRINAHGDTVTVRTTRSPLRFNGRRPSTHLGAPRRDARTPVGELLQETEPRPDVEPRGMDGLTLDQGADD